MPGPLALLAPIMPHLTAMGTRAAGMKIGGFAAGKAVQSAGKAAGRGIAKAATHPLYPSEGMTQGIVEGMVALGDPSTAIGKAGLASDLGFGFGPMLAGAFGSAATARERQQDAVLTALRDRPGEMRTRMIKLKEAMENNEARLATLRPDVYTELLVGRKLAPGTRVYGALNDRSTLEQVLMEMSNDNAANYSN